MSVWGGRPRPPRNLLNRLSLTDREPQLLAISVRSDISPAPKI